MLRALAATAVGAGVTGCSTPSVPKLDSLVLLTGPPGAVFREIGASMVTVIAANLPNTHVTAKPTTASVANLRLLADNQGQLGLSTLDAAESGGVGPVGISAVGRLFDSFLHLVVLQNSPVQSLADLKGKTLSLGAAGSSTEFTGTRLLALRGLSVHDVRLTQTDAANALANGSIDGFLTLTGIPTPAITSLAKGRPVRLVPLADEATALANAFPGPYVPATIPATTYEGVRPCPTVAVPNLLLARDDLADDVVEVVTGTVFTQVDAITTGHPEARRINVRTGISTGVVPLHPGAARWFTTAKR
jgi:TRAP transporter TAXI family solute receptor